MLSGVLLVIRHSDQADVPWEEQRVGIVYETIQLNLGCAEVQSRTENWFSIKLRLIENRNWVYLAIPNPTA